MSSGDGETCSASGAVICSRGHGERWGIMGELAREKVGEEESIRTR